ncbi:MAG: hypothetical protein AAFU79_02240 [Myxococcota bacterium]
MRRKALALLLGLGACTDEANGVGPEEADLGRVPAEADLGSVPPGGDAGAPDARVADAGTAAVGPEPGACPLAYRLPAGLRPQVAPRDGGAFVAAVDPTSNQLFLLDFRRDGETFSVTPLEQDSQAHTLRLGLDGRPELLSYTSGTLPFLLFSGDSARPAEVFDAPPCCNRSFSHLGLGTGAVYLVYDRSDRVAHWFGVDGPTRRYEAGDRAQHFGDPSGWLLADVVGGASPQLRLRFGADLDLPSELRVELGRNRDTLPAAARGAGESWAVAYTENETGVVAFLESPTSTTSIQPISMPIRMSRPQLLRREEVWLAAGGDGLQEVHLYVLSEGQPRDRWEGCGFPSFFETAHLAPGRDAETWWFVAGDDAGDLWLLYGRL